MRTANAKFGDQAFKTSIAVIELHKIRYGEYPDQLEDLKYLGDWDEFIYNYIEYNRLEDGYELNLIKGIGNSIIPDYPEEFWSGIGLLKSNLR